MMNWGKQPAKVNPESKKKLEKFVIENIDSPISILYLRSLGKQGSTGRIRVNTLMKQGLGIKMDNLNKVVK